VPASPATAASRGQFVALVAALALLLACLVAEALTHPRLSALGEYNYLDVARHVARGDGLVQSTLGYNAASFPADGGWPVPFVAQPPLYPILVGGLVRAGIEPLRAGLLISLIALALVWTFGFLLARTLWDTEAAAVATVVLMLATIPTGTALHARSDLPAIALVLLSVWIEARHLRDRATATGRMWQPLAAGVAAGAAFAVRYLLALALPLGIAFLSGWPPSRRRLAAAGAFGLG
jgi:hypothetical protein